MTHKDIYTKFMIEYDKANVTSSYPHLTKYEVATILDKAYLALIARKMVGNNPRLSTFESDIKAIEDLRPLVVNKLLNTSSNMVYADNEFIYTLPDEMLYPLEGQAEFNRDMSPIDDKPHRNELVNITSHQIAQRFKASNTNLPWIKQPVAFIEGSDIHVLIDSYKHKNDAMSFLLTYLKKPAKFIDSLTRATDDEPVNPGGGEQPEPITVDPPTISGTVLFEDSTIITITAQTGTLIYYTINDEDVVSNGTLYAYPFSLSDTATIRAVAVKDGVYSTVSTKLFTKRHIEDIIPITSGEIQVTKLSQSSLSEYNLYEVIYRGTSNISGKWSAAIWTKSTDSTTWTKYSGFLQETRYTYEKEESGIFLNKTLDAKAVLYFNDLEIKTVTVLSDEVIIPQDVWTLDDIYGSSYVNNASNTEMYSVWITNGAEQSRITTGFSISFGSQYATITENGVLAVKPAATSWLTIVIRVTYLNSFKEKEVLVIYNSDSLRDVSTSGQLDDFVLDSNILG